MFPINDALDAILLGTFLFGILFTIGSFALGLADVGMDHSSGDHGFGSFFNVTAILAFITWFGGVGYLVRNGLGWHWAFAILMAVAGGLVAATLVRFFIVKVLRSGSEALDPRDFEKVGVLARVTSPIRSGGVGEIVWEQHGARMVTSARSATVDPVARGTEVLILGVERGVAIVEPFDGLLGREAGAASGRREGMTT